MSSLKNVKIFADGADLDAILALYKNPSIKGFTTNPTLMRKAGIENYEAFARQLIKAVPDRPLSFEVFADDFDEMIERLRQIEPDPTKTFGVEASYDYSKVHEIWGLR